MMTCVFSRSNLKTSDAYKKKESVFTSLESTELLRSSQTSRSGCFWAMFVVSHLSFRCSIQWRKRERAKAKKNEPERNRQASRNHSPISLTCHFSRSMRRKHCLYDWHVFLDMKNCKKGTLEKNRKLVVVGDGMAGKTCLLYAFKDDNFDPTHPPTIFETYAAEVQLDGQTVSEPGSPRSP